MALLLDSALIIVGIVLIYYLRKIRSEQTRIFKRLMNEEEPEDEK